MKARGIATSGFFVSDKPMNTFCHLLIIELFTQNKKYQYLQSTYQ
jgi:hypothetical protein